jgi:hypothetical protein
MPHHETGLRCRHEATISGNLFAERSLIQASRRAESRVDRTASGSRVNSCMYYEKNGFAKCAIRVKTMLLRSRKGSQEGESHNSLSRRRMTAWRASENRCGCVTRSFCGSLTSCAVPCCSCHPYTSLRRLCKVSSSFAIESRGRDMTCLWVRVFSRRTSLPRMLIKRCIMYLSHFASFDGSQGG